MNASDVIDTGLDRSIALGYSKVGLAVRRRLPGWPADPPRMDGKVALVTGAASGIGLAACQGFARLGATVLPVARSEARAAEAQAEILAAVAGAEVRPLVCDVSSLAELRAFTDSLARTEPRLDVLVNNAGSMPDERRRSADGVELMFATHVLAPFVLIARLRGLLERTAPSIVINVSSGGMYSQRLPGDDLQSEHASYNPPKIYARTKREQVVITEEWAERLRGTGVMVHAMHPGWADTKGVQDALPVFRVLVRPIIRDLDAGADTIVWLGAAPEARRSTGGFWHDRRARPTHYRLGAGRESEADRQRLWDLCRSLMGEDAPGR
jgi:dehydrogenase/reductase SDR family protein 12